MKKLLLSLGLAIPAIVTAQLPYFVNDSININNINALVGLHGDLWFNATEGAAGCRFPNGTMKNVGYGSFLILSGYDNTNTLHLSASNYVDTFQGEEVDYWPGPLDNSGNTDIATINKWAKIWKINKTDIDDFLAQTSHTLLNTPDPVLRWPAKGNPFATDVNNTTLGITEDMAPFHDLNNNGNYEPLQGEFPKIKGDQMLWWVVNDNSPIHSNTETVPLKVQVEISAYAYSRGTLIDNVVYYEYKIKNRSGINYTDVRFGQYTDFDLGLYVDDYAGLDSSFRMGFVFNANDTDGVNNYPGSYGTDIPVAGLTFVHVPGDDVNYKEPLGGFKVIPLQNNTTNAAFYDNGIRNITMTFLDTCSNNPPAGDRKMMMGTGDFDLPANSFQAIVTALVVANPSGNNYCPNFDPTTIAIVADTAWGNFNFPLALNPSYNPIRPVNIYPNPATEFITIEGVSSSNCITIYDAIGKKRSVSISNNGHKSIVDLDPLPTGLYMLILDGIQAGTFIKR